MSTALIAGAIATAGLLGYGLWRLHRDPLVGDTPVADYLTAAAECGHPRPIRPYSVEKAHEVMRELRATCDAPHCPAKGMAYRVLVQAGQIQPDPRMEWMAR